jgi:hypothetical protein
MLWVLTENVPVMGHEQHVPWLKFTSEHLKAIPITFLHTAAADASVATTDSTAAAATVITTRIGVAAAG